MRGRVVVGVFTQEGHTMRTTRNIFCALLLAGSLAGCVVYGGHGGHGYGYSGGYGGSYGYSGGYQGYGGGSGYHHYNNW